MPDVRTALAIRIGHSVVLGLLALSPACAPVQLAAADRPSPPSRFQQQVPGSTATLDLVLIPAEDNQTPALVAPFYLSTTEIPWDLYDLFVFRLDDENQELADKGADAISRPSKPYIPPDRGFGHSGYPAISMTAKGAQEFCVWLSARTGRNYRLPTEAEWEHACRAGADTAPLADRAWFAENAGNKTHALAQKQPSPTGLFDMHGNAAEWVIGHDGKPVTRGGSYLDTADRVGCAARAKQTSDWNASDPQFPKSAWWLADAPFVGFRVVCEVDPATPKQGAQ
jgi:formylglycine-generating enzyme required for sulfatase activity